jgi:zinc transport system substrate-binding protein
MGAGSANTPDIVTTIRPIHSLVAGLTEPMSTPVLLIDEPQSPHQYHLKPSDVKKLNQADLVIYAGPQVESLMQKLFSRLPDKHVIAWSAIPGMTLYPGRALHPDDHGHQEHDLDGHLWLSIENAKTFVRYLLPLLIELDSENSNLYRTNADKLIARLDRHQQIIREQLAGVADTPFLQFHDAFQYFEREFGLSGGHFFTSGAEHKIGIRRLREIRQAIVDTPIHCIYYEPPTVPPILRNLSIPHETQLLPLEPIGWEMTVGADLYFDLMDNIANQLAVCLKAF